MVLLHIGGGGASRAPDISRLSLANTTAGQRSIFFLRDKGCCSILPNSKTENTFGGTKIPIPRLYEIRLSNILSQYLFLFRRLHCLFSTMQYGRDVPDVFQKQLLVFRGKATNGPWNRVVFTKVQR